MNDSTARRTSDRELLDRYAAGDDTAFRQLIEQNRDRMWAVAMRTTRDPELAADAVQDAFLRASQGWASLRADSSVTTWLHRLVVNAALDRVRARHIPERLRKPVSPDPAEEVVVRRAVNEALAKLPEPQRAVLQLVDALGYSVDETAKMLGVAPGTVKSRAARGRAHLAKVLGHLRSATPAEHQDSEGEARRLLERFFSRPGVSAETVEASVARVNAGLERLFLRLGPPEGGAGG